ncbi:hypothetical protein ACW9HQ_41915, partial [Nocardia gipuzkoensis]
SGQIGKQFAQRYLWPAIRRSNAAATEREEASKVAPRGIRQGLISASGHVSDAISNAAPKRSESDRGGDRAGRTYTYQAMNPERAANMVGRLHLQRALVASVKDVAAVVPHNPNTAVIAPPEPENKPAIDHSGDGQANGATGPASPNTNQRTPAPATPVPSTGGEGDSGNADMARQPDKQQGPVIVPVPEIPVPIPVPVPVPNPKSPPPEPPFLRQFLEGIEKMLRELDRLPARLQWQLLRLLLHL